MALFSNNTCSNLVAIGDSALYNNGSGETGSYANGNTAVGSKALFSNTSGSSNVAVGTNSLLTNAEGINNVAVGAGALRRNITGNGNSAVGWDALSFSTGYENTAMGASAIESNASGIQNTAFGNNTLMSSVGDGNTAIGYDALKYNHGNYNVGIGWETMSTPSHNSSYNVGIGYRALHTNSTGTENTAVGSFSLMLNYSGEGNTALGSGALGVAEGSCNTAVGTNAGENIKEGSNNTCIGYNADVNFRTMDDCNAFGSWAMSYYDHSTMIGDLTQEVIGGQVGWSSWGDGRFKTNVTEDVKGLQFILKLRPVTFNVEYRKLMDFQMKSLPDKKKQLYLRDHNLPDVNPLRQTGFIAQEVESAAKAVGYDFDGVHVPGNENDHYSLVYGSFVVPLVKAVQEQQTMIDDLKKENAELKARLEAIESRLK
jgi:hypothetical protein